MKKRIYILMVQRANFPNSDASEVRRAFQEAAASALNSASWEKEVRAFEREDLASRPPQGAICLSAHRVPGSGKRSRAIFLNTK